ncbi:MAG: hypothetical protein JNM59_01990 [Hyphomonadaceae bacterium]|nr:hypothetical protein [Hyphomonadaceae bacterium]
MPDCERRAILLEEYKELGEEYRYRDQLMVQEFSLSMVAIGVVLNQVWAAKTSIELFAADFLSFGFLCILAIHLGRLNQDRVSALDRKGALAKELGFDDPHGEVSKRRQRLVPVGAPALMVGFVQVLALAWFCAATSVALQIFPWTKQSYDWVIGLTR